MTAAVTIIAALAGLAIFLARKCTAARGLLTVAEVRCLAEDVAGRHFPIVDPMLLRAIAEVESARDSFAIRVEESIGDASIGLMQTLEGTAQWLWDDIGDRRFPRPTRATLFKPSTSLYFGARYIAWLQRFRPGATEEWIVRAYNGGPGGASRSATLAHWQRYQRAKARLIAGGS